MLITVVNQEVHTFFGYDVLVGFVLVTHDMHVFKGVWLSLDNI